MTRRDPIGKKPLGVQLDLSIVGIVGFLKAGAWTADTTQAVTGHLWLSRVWVVDTGWLGTG